MEGKPSTPGPRNGTGRGQAPNHDGEGSWLPHHACILIETDYL